MQAMNFQSASSADDAVTKLGASEDGKLLAGGQTLIPAIKQRLNAPTDLVSLAGAGLSGVSVEGGDLVIGAMTTHAEVAADTFVREHCPGLASLAAGIGDPAVRHRGTIGGSVANNDPAADYPAGLVALGADVVTNTRTIAAEDFFVGLFETALNDSEVITSVRVPACNDCAYAKFPNPASRYAMVGVFVAKSSDGTRVAVTGAGENGVFRHGGLESALSADFSSSAVDATEASSDGLMSDIHGSADYRAALIKAMSKKAVSDV